MSSHETCAKNKCCARQDTHQMKHACSGHFWLPEHQPYWNARTHLMSTEEFEKKLFPQEEWSAQRHSLHGVKTDVGNKLVSVNIPFGSRAIVQYGKTLFNISI